jgi:hypothetical protein
MVLKYKTHFFILVALLLLPLSGFAHTSQDSTADTLRPRRDVYIIESFPSPARLGQIVNISYYNHNPMETSLIIVDINDKLIAELQPRKFVQNEVHKFEFKTSKVATGSYYLRLKTYTSTGSLDQTQSSRFVVLH